MLAFIYAPLMHMFEYVFNLSELPLLELVIANFSCYVVVIFLILFILVFTSAYIRLSMDHEKIKKLLDKSSNILGSIVGTFMGLVTPINIYSVVPLFAILSKFEMPLSLRFTYILAVPIINEIRNLSIITFYGVSHTILNLALNILLCTIAGIVLNKIIKLEDINLKELSYEKYINGINSNNQVKNKFKYCFREYLFELKELGGYLIFIIIINIFLGVWLPMEVNNENSSIINTLAFFLYDNFGIGVEELRLQVLAFTDELKSPKGIFRLTLFYYVISTLITVPEMLSIRRLLKRRAFIKFLIVATATILISILGFYITTVHMPLV